MTFSDILAIIGIILSILIPVGLYFKELKRNKKNLSYSVLYKQQLISPTKSLLSGLKFVYNKKEINDLLLLHLEIKNTGKKEIVKEDFDIPLEFSFNENSKILDVQIVDKQPPSLQVNYKIKKNLLRFEPMLLNSKDRFRFKIYLTNSDYLKYTFSVRIKGVKDLKKIDELEIANRYLWTGSVMMILGVIILYLKFPEIIDGNGIKPTMYNFYNFIPFIIGFILLLVAGRKAKITLDNLEKWGAENF